MRLAGVRLCPHHEGLGEGEDGPGELVAQHLAAVALLGVPLGHIVQVLTPGDVEVVVVAVLLAIPWARDVFVLEAYICISLKGLPLCISLKGLPQIQYK